MLGHFQDAVDDCTHALKLKEDYVKALLRRCASYEKTDDMENALLDAKKVIPFLPYSWPPELIRCPCNAP